MEYGNHATSHVRCLFSCRHDSELSQRFRDGQDRTPQTIPYVLDSQHKYLNSADKPVNDFPACAYCLLTTALLQKAYVGTGSEGANAAALVFIFMYFVFYGFCVDPPQFVWCAEVFPTTIRAVGIGVTSFPYFVGAIVSHFMLFPSDENAIDTYRLLDLYHPWWSSIPKKLDGVIIWHSSDVL